MTTNLRSVRNLSNGKRTIFVSHSSKDTETVLLIELSFANRRIKPYFAKSRMEGKNPVEKIIEAIGKSIGLFALITPNVVKDTYTRDWVVFEIGVAKAKGIPIFCWIDEKVAVTKNFPKLLENITDYDHFDCQKIDDCIRVANSVRDKASALGRLRKKSSDFSEEQLKTELSQIEQAHAVAKKSLEQKAGASESTSGKGIARKSRLLPDSRKIADLDLDNSYLDQIYDTAKNLAKDKYLDARFASFEIVVHPFLQTRLPRVSVLLSFYSALTGKICLYHVSDANLQVEHFPPDKEAKDNFGKMVLKNLPWKESPNWKQFLQLSIAKIGPLSPNWMTSYVLSARPWGIATLGETDLFWHLGLNDNFSGREYSFRWNGLEVNADNVKQDL